MKSKWSSKASFSLVEALLAMTILGIAISGILTTFSAALVAGRVSEDYATVASLMNELRTQVRTNMLSPDQVNEGQFASHPEFSWRVTYFYTDIENLYQVQYAVYWTRGRRDYQVVYDSFHLIPVMEEEIEQS